VRQYRTRISQWRKDKKIKLHEMQAIVRKRQRRKLIENSKAELVFEVPPQKIERWIKRHEVVESFLYAPSPGPLAAERIPTGGNQKPDSRSNKRSRIPPPKAPPTILISANLDSSLLSQDPSAHTSDWAGIQSCPPKLSSPVERHVASNLCPSFHTSFGLNDHTESVASWREAYAIRPQQLEMPTPLST
jgi:hypothetical protein